MRDYDAIYKHCPKVGEEMFRNLQSIKSDMLAVSEEFYPLGLAGWKYGVDKLSDRAHHDDEKRMLTTVPQVTLKKAAAGMLQNLTSKGQPWFYLDVPRVMKEKFENQKRKGLEKITEAARYLMARSNVYSSIHRLFLHYLVYGFGCMLITPADEESGNIIEAATLRPGTYAFGIGRSGRVTSVVRKFAWKPIQILEEFGSRNVPEWVKDLAKEGSERRLVVWNLIEPNYCGKLRKFDPVSVACELSSNCHWRSIYWLEAGRKNTSDPRHGILAIDGFEINPIIAPRLDCELGDIYGRGLGIDGLDLARGLQSFRYDIYKISGDKSDPALVVSSDLKDEGLNVGRGAINYVRFGEQKQGFVFPVLPTPPTTEDTRQCELVAKQELETLFYIDAFASMDLYKDNIGKVTATQINYAKAEGMQKLGAMVSNCEVEFLNILVNTVWRWAVRCRVAPIDDETVAFVNEIGREVQPEYVSNIHQARKLAEMNGIQAWLQNVEMTARIKEGAIDVPSDIIDADKVNEHVADILNVPFDCRKDKKALEKIRGDRAEMAKKAQEAEELEKTASAANKIGNTPISEDRLLAPLARAATGLG